MDPRSPDSHKMNCYLKTAAYHVLGRYDRVDPALVHHRGESINAEEAAKSDPQERDYQQHGSHFAVRVVEGEESESHEEEDQRFRSIGDGLVGGLERLGTLDEDVQ